MSTYDIIDAQIHLGPGRIEETLAQMDALGIAGAVVDEYWLRSFANEPHAVLADGVQRPLAPTAQLAALLHPTRFSWLLRISRDDPEYAAVIAQAAAAPGCRALRIDPGMSPAMRQSFADGGYDHIARAAAEHGLPLCIFCPDSPDALARLALTVPEARIIIDHCGVFSNSMRTSFGGLPPLSVDEQSALFDRVLALAEHSNVALKWGHASGMFDLPVWPGESLWPLLRRAITAFGADRILWESDFSVNQRGESWADLLYGVKGNPDLSEHERTLLLGGAARVWFNWL